MLRRTTTTSPVTKDGGSELLQLVDHYRMVHLATDNRVAGVRAYVGSHHSSDIRARLLGRIVMNTYSVAYSTNGVWTFLCVRDVSIYTVLEWAKATIQQKGICVSIVDEPEAEDVVDTRSWIKQFRSKRWEMTR